MGGTHHIVVGNKGRIVVPADVRERNGITEGSVLVLLESPSGMALLTREQLRARVRDELADAGDVVGSLLAERRESAAAEDVA